MNYIKYIFGFGAVMLLLNACSEDLFTQIVEIEVPEHVSGISIGADFSQNRNEVVVLQASKGIQESGDLEDIQNAKVELKLDGVVIKSFEEDFTNGNGRAGRYVNIQDIELTAGVTYTLEVEKEGYSKAAATQVMPAPVPINNVEYVADGYADPDGYRSDKLSITFSDPAGIENYYSVKATLFQSYDGIPYGNRIYIYNDIDPLIEYGGTENVVINGAAFDGNEVTFDFSMGWSHQTEGVDSLVVELLNLSKDKYLFERSLRIYDDSEYNPFVEPVIVHENVEGGHGLFGLSYVARKSIEFN